MRRNRTARLHTATATTRIDDPHGNAPRGSRGDMDFIKIPDENVEVLLGAALSLFCVLMAHEIVEGIVVYSRDGVSESAIRNWALLRSHASLSETVHILRGHPLIGAQYHAHSHREANCETCAAVEVGPVMYWRYIAILCARMFLISIEVIFIALSLTRKQYLPVTEGGVMVTWKSSGFGNSVSIKPELGCFLAPAYNLSVIKDSGNKAMLTRQVYCLESKKRGTGGVAMSRDFIEFEVIVDTKQNSVIVDSRTGEFNTLYFRAFWSTSQREGLEIPLMQWNTTTRSNLCKDLYCTEEWSTSVNNSLRTLYGSSYRPVLEAGIVHPRKYITIPFKISTGGEWPPILSSYWSKQRKLEETLRIMSNIVELSVVENGSTIIYSRDGVLENLSVDRAILLAAPIASTGVLLVLLILLLILRFCLGCVRPNRYCAGVYSVLRKHVGLGYGCSPLTIDPVRQRSTQVVEHVS